MAKTTYVVYIVLVVVLCGGIGSLFGQTGAYIGFFIGIIAGLSKIVMSFGGTATREHISKFSISIVFILFISSWGVGEYFNHRINTIEQAAKATIAANTLKHKKNIARLKAKHKKEVTKTKVNHKKQVAKIKMKERSKRWFSSIPILGTVLLFWTGKDEYDDYESWKQENPNGSAESYAKYKGELLIP